MLNYNKIRMIKIDKEALFSKKIKQKENWYYLFTKWSWILNVIINLLKSNLIDK